MSASQFDDLLGDFGDTSTTTKATSNGNIDQFDPFGPSDGEQISNGGDSGLLVDFSVDSQVTNGESSNGVDFDFDASGSANPLYNMSMDAQSSNPLYELSSGPANPLYEYVEEDSNQSANPLYDLSTNTTDSQPSNPLYDLEDAGEEGSDDIPQQADLGTTEEASHSTSIDLLAESDDLNQTEQSNNGEDQPEVLNGDPDLWVQPNVNEQFKDQDYFSTETVEEADKAIDEGDLTEEIPDEISIPTVEVSQSCEETAQQVESEEDVAFEREAVYPISSQAASIHHDMLTPDNYGHDRREEDLENYCMDREESDLMEEQEESHVYSLKPRDERSRSPSRSIGPDVSEDPVGANDLGVQDDNYSSEETDIGSTLRARDDRSHAPSRSLEPEDSPNKVQEEETTHDGHIVSKTTHSESRYSDSGFQSTQQSTNQWEEERNGHNAEENREQDIVHFSEMSSVKNKFESQQPQVVHRQVDIKEEVSAAEGGVYESQPQTFQQWQNEEEEEEGVYESQPIRRDDVAREADKDITAGLPPVGTAQSIRAKFLSSSSQEAPRKREITPPLHGAGAEYVSEPRGYIEKYEGKADAGVFESQPVVNPDVVTSATTLEDAKPEQGFAKNVAAKFRELESKNSSYSPSAKREITPDRSGRIEYVSEPRGHFEKYEGKADSGVFESQPAINPDVVRSGEEVKEELPERGTAKNLAQKFRQISHDNTSPPSASTRAKKELTPDRSGRIEYVSEPRGQSETYEVRVDSGVFENEPQRNLDVVNSETSTEEYLPERGFAKNVAAKFKSLESSVKSPPLSPGRRKEFTPPREEERAKQSVVLENTPEYKPELIHSGDQLEEALPERGTAKNIAQRFRQLESESKAPSSPKQKKEFTPPPHDSGVYENQPKQFHADYNRPAESGILENKPIIREDVVRSAEPVRYEEELPERGTAKNMVSKWRQLETSASGAKSPGSSGRPKEFTPPREEPRIAQQRKSPRTPLSPSGYDQLDNGSVHPSDLPGQYQPQNAPTVFESTPEVRNDTAREADTDWTEGMPKKDTAKKMLAKFQHIQEEAKKTQPPVVRKEPEIKQKTPRKVGRSKSMRAAVQTEKCGACEKTVYAMERLEMNKRVYHKACFRCSQCKAVLTPKTFAINNEIIFCTTHYKQLFATKGNYDEGFGRMQHKKRWSSNPNLHEREGEGETNHTS
ncbi:uncharacterized protein LOC131948855 isoform X3 [Physella acuta]|uniref:uncharacterized protein LOC131948855 isoform X3 n=1 Tax=Physella acuta TaxID=109671 RepID=UPI0027DDAD34|nr:uncharacterized protein LOC131948855 isoform X3 [Physella acuta]